MQKVIDPCPPAESASQDAAEGASHRLTRAWGGVAGECGVECECGVTYDGFDTIAEAETLLTEHIEKAAITHPSWCDQTRCWAYESDADNPPVGGYHESAPIVVDTLNPTGLTLHLTLDHGTPAAAPEVVLCTGEPDGVECKHLSLDQAGQLFDALRVLVPHLTNGLNTVRLYSLGVENGRKKAEQQASKAIPVNRVSPDTLDALDRIKKHLDDADRDKYRAYCLGWVDGNDGRAPEFEVTR